MISHRTTFVTYEIMALHNIYLDDDGVVEAIGIGSIVVELMVKRQNEINLYQRYFSCTKIASKIVLGEQTFVEWVENAFEPK